ncbi:putative polynucleotide adenylyltransferase [Helianthus annuus]|uniref:Polynucleotide adenylyltransferase n=1 Tax=Helianthus annuus TaxID=4232 RepID=A0A251TAG3_HELAN|nr:uncharacterized protein LOC110890371 isoform X1 [Helianthus annuus]KAF5782262.1 putative polynucleotide adenylyltransferase [Helianthus annuus]KAJ0501763.1 putative polynucleotide adenylyltransferase [Helianthus annuus]KAJ0509667.1 putative polynucleotide adenylyltransferase [Helianthus annuus]KAJ0517686.1 putative polynucleotide adenylyltransferase [Helianthus annuus]KAJ0685703.1 putative polynucleotide adenylyltransferase [Helianthus annuus]
MGDASVDDDRTVVSCFAAPLGNPDPNSIRVETWVVAEDAVREVLSCIHPTLDSDEKRKYVIEYVQKLIRCNLGFEIFPYGSVPLKTYLPDGDIDLTVLSIPNLEERLPSEVLRVLLEEEKHGNTEYELRDTQFIDAEVKLVKCIVQDIVIDISFNQLGGLSTLCFLEQVDRLAGKDHLYKRSLILIKAWCYYESRILGAHHGLISTYALEILVLYIFQIFHASLNGPLEVLYRFLDYYAKFDWDNYCISLDGPVCKSSLPGLAAELLDDQGTRDVLLDAEFRKNCMDMFIVPCKGAEADLRTFSLKNLNIVDPLKEYNNLGRSVHKGNYFRVRSAFRYGARRLGKILQPNINIEDEIKVFFKNTLQRHTPAPTLISAANGLSISPRSESYYEDDMYSRFSNGDLDTESNLEEEPEFLDGITAVEWWVERGDAGCLRGNMDNNNSSSDNSCFDDNEKDVSDDDLGETEMLNMFPDLTGDYDGHIRNLLYGQGCHGYALSTAMVWASLSPPTSPYGDENPWDPAHSWPNYSNTSNGNVGNDALRGTGPYIPVISCDACEDTSGRGRDRVHRAGVGSVETNPASRIPPELSPKPAGANSSLSNQTQQQVGQANSTATGFINQPRKLEFGSFRSLTESPSDEQNLEVDPSGREQESSMESSLHLNNEDEFPPLSAA